MKPWQPPRRPSGRFLTPSGRNAVVAGLIIATVALAALWVGFTIGRG